MLNKVLIRLSILILNFGFFFAAEKESYKDSIKVYETPSITVTTNRAVAGQSPVPFNEITKSDIDKSNTVQDIPNLLNGLPSIIFYSENGNNVGYSYITMRGFSQRQLSIMVNGIPQNDPEDHNVYWIDMPDLAASVDNIQVQRGAGLSNYGAAALGGSINLSTFNYINRKGVFLTTGVGFQQFGNEINPNTNKESIEFSSGITGNYAFYCRFSRVYSGGYRERAWANLNSYFLSASRFDDNLTTQINLFGGPINDGLAYTGVPKDYISDLTLRRKNPGWGYWVYDSTGKNKIPWTSDLERSSHESEGFTQPHFEILNDWKISDKVRFLSSLFYYQGVGYFDGYNSAAWSDTTTFRISSQYGYNPTAQPGNSIIRSWVVNNQGGWIPRIIISHDGGEFTAGAEFRIHRSDHYANILFAENLPVGFDPDYKVYSYQGIRNIISGFAKEKWYATDKLILDFEAQLVSQTYAISGEKWGNIPKYYHNIDGEQTGGTGNIFSVNYLFFNPRIGATYEIDKTMNVYIFSAYTSREPRLSNLYDASSSMWGYTPKFETKIMPDSSIAYNFKNPVIKPEQLIDMELGYTYRNVNIYFNANFYWMEYNNELVISGKTSPFGESIEENAPKSRHLGAELQIKANLIKSKFGSFDISANTTISKNTIVKYDLTSKNTTESLAGNQIAGFPDFMGNLILSYSMDDLFFSLHGQYVGSFRSDNFGDLLTSNPDFMRQIMASSYYADNKVEAYTVLNFNMGYTLKNIFTFQHLKLHAQINNLLNKLYAANALGKEFFPAAERNFFVGIELGF